MQRFWRKQDYLQLGDTLKARANSYDSQVPFERCGGDQRINIANESFLMRFS